MPVNLFLPGPLPKQARAAKYFEGCQPRPWPASASSMAPPLQLLKAAPAEVRCQNKPKRPSRPRKQFRNCYAARFRHLKLSATAFGGCQPRPSLSKVSPAEVRCQNKPKRPSRPRKLFLCRVSKVLWGSMGHVFATL